MTEHLQFRPENAYMPVFRDIVGKYIVELTASAPLLLSDAAQAGLEKAYYETAYRIAGDTLEGWMTSIIARENPFAAAAAAVTDSEEVLEAATACVGTARRSLCFTAPPDSGMNCCGTRFRTEFSLCFDAGSFCSQHIY